MKGFIRIKIHIIFSSVFIIFLSSFFIIVLYNQKKEIYNNNNILEIHEYELNNNTITFNEDNIEDNDNTNNVNEKIIEDYARINDNIQEEFDNIALRFIFNEIENEIEVDNFLKLRDRMELHTALWHSIFGKYDPSDEDEKYPLELYKEKLINESSFLVDDNIYGITGKKKVLAHLHQHLYPWFYYNRYNSLSDLIQTSQGRGIVICTGHKHFRYARSTIDSLRNVLNCTLPIQVFYNGNDDLPVEEQDILWKYDNISVDDISYYFDNQAINIEGWAIKPFAVLASKFEEVIIIDADVVYLHDPEELFDNKNYQKTGTIFFRDRTLYPGINHRVRWLHYWMEDPLPESKNTRFYNYETIYEMDSSTVVIHKTKTLLGLLTTCKLNEGNIRTEVVYKVVHGDKETFWMGYDMARQHYYLNTLPCVFVGNVTSGEVCGHVGHVLDNVFYYWNGHIVKNKDYEDDLELVQFNGYHFESNETEWKKDLSCLLYNDTQPIYFSEEEQSTFNKILERERINHFIIKNNTLSDNNLNNL